MKKLFGILLAVVMMFSVVGVLAACNTSTEIYMITDIGDIDDKSFNEGTWNGVKEWATKNNKSYAYLKPTSSEKADLDAAIALAVKGGAKVIVCPGFVFTDSINDCAKKYPEVKFVLLDSQAATAANVASFSYNAEYSGWLAGYAAVKEGMTKLAYMGGIGYPTVYSFGIGFVQGAEQAAKEAEVEAVECKWTYTGDFAANDANKTKAKGLFEGGTELIFSVGGANQQSCFAAAAESTGKWVISPDTDSTSLSEKCLTSALKELAKTVETALDDIYTKEGATYLGKHSVMSIDGGYVGLAPNFSRFTKFTEAMYKDAVSKLQNGTYKCKLVSEQGVEDFHDDIAASGETAAQPNNVAALSTLLGLSKVQVVLVK